MALPDGVYLGLSDADYFAEDALGSTDLVKLHKRRHGWWWSSRHNPDYREPKNKARGFGRALHTILLEGLRAYETRYVVEPDKPKDAAVTIDQMKAALAGAGLNIEAPGLSKWKAWDWQEAMRDNLPDFPCWPNIQADFLARLKELGDSDEHPIPTVTALEDRMLRVMLDAAMGNDGIRALLDDRSHPPLAEVSVFATLRDGTRRRWRFDRLYPGFTMDLKSLSGWTGRPLPWATGDQIAKYSMDIQRADYDRGRLVLNAFVRDGFQVFGGEIEERDWLRQLVDLTAAEAGWDWVWLFYQKPDPKGDAPVIFPVMDERWELSFGSEDAPSDHPVRVDGDMFKYGAAKADDGLAFYRAMKAEFGLDRPWSYVEDLHYTSEARQPRIFLPHWLADTGAVADPAAYGAEEGATDE